SGDSGRRCLACVQLKAIRAPKTHRAERARMGDPPAQTGRSPSGPRSAGGRSPPSPDQLRRAPGLVDLDARGCDHGFLLSAPLNDRGSPMSALWQLDPAIDFLNHGSFGACPRAVLEAQREWHDRLEREPVTFMMRELEGHLEAARADI